MSDADYYMNLPYDLSGSRSKNRFRNEVLWGLKKMFDLYKADVDFTVVFDYVCDIEVHKEDGFEFYQIKTQTDGAYTLDKLLKRNKQGDSIFGKLFKLRFNNNGKAVVDTKVALVSNAALSDGTKTFNNIEVVHFSSIDPSKQRKIKGSVIEELDIKNNIDLKNTSFIKTGMDLINPEKSLIGETSLFFEETFNSEPKKVNSLYRLLSTEIDNKASYELKILTYDEVLIKKGVSKSFLVNVLSNYIENTDVSIERAKNFIRAQYENDFKLRMKYNRALSQVVGMLSTSKFFQTMERDMVNYIRDNLDTLPNTDLEIIEEVTEFFIPDKPIEISKDEVQMLVLIILQRLEEGTNI